MDDAVDRLFHDTILAVAAPRGAAEPHWAQCSVPGCLALVPGARSLAVLWAGGPASAHAAAFCAARLLNTFVAPTETPRSGNRLAHVAWVTRVCVDHLRHGDVYLRDEEPQRLCWKCHRLQPVTAFEVRCVPACAAARC
jgi:hypothetical protein